MTIKASLRVILRGGGRRSPGYRLPSWPARPDGIVDTSQMADDDVAVEHLVSPPINEVVCGFIFDPLKGLDPVLVGAYWSTRTEEFPEKHIGPPIADATAPFFGDMLMVRTLLIDKAQVFLLQIQTDRFYLNWRRRNDEYPRFSDHPGQSIGILSKALAEFERFQIFCESHLGKRPLPSRLELAKVDCLVESKHWRNLEDLSTLLPFVKPLSGLAQGADPQLALHFAEDRPTGRLSVSFALAKRSGENGTQRVLNLESRMSAAMTTNPKDDFARLNVELNHVFASLIPREERDARFGGQK